MLLLLLHADISVISVIGVIVVVGRAFAAVVVSVMLVADIIDF